jgi:centromere protein C
MAPRASLKARDFDYSNVGKAGRYASQAVNQYHVTRLFRPSGTQLTVNRRTGITLAEGKRDEHGMEEVDGIFSSPEKSPLGENGLVTSESIGSDMSMDEGNSSPQLP